MQGVSLDIFSSKQYSLSLCFPQFVHDMSFSETILELLLILLLTTTFFRGTTNELMEIYT